MPKNPAKDGRQKGAVPHAEGAHGLRTHRKIIEQLESGPSGEERSSANMGGDPMHREEGKHRLFEGRKQHDHAAKKSEKTRLSRDIDRHKHNRENYQVKGGTETHPAMPRHKKPPRLPEEPGGSET
jgi:hypothetical protein